MTLHHRRRLWLVLLAGLVLAAIVWAWAMTTAKTTELAKHITNGMTAQQVEDTFGRSPDAFLQLTGRPLADVDHADLWDFCDGYVLVYFDKNSSVIDQRVFSVGILRYQFRRLLDKIGY